MSKWALSRYDVKIVVTVTILQYSTNKSVVRTIFKFNKTGNVLRNITLMRLPATTVAVEE